MNNYRILILALFLIAAGGTCASATVISVSPVTLSPGAEGTATLTLDSITEGLSGYQLKVASDNQGVVSVTGATFPEWASLSEAVPGEGGSYALRAIDLKSGVEKGASNINLATVSVKAASAGNAQITISDVKIDDDAGNAVTAEVKSGSVSVTGSDSQSSPTTEPTTLPVTSVPTTVPPALPVTSIPTTVPPTLPPDSQQSGTEQVLQVTLKTGWNLINIPMQPVSGFDTAAIFKSVPNAGHSILTYDGSGGWQTLGQNSNLQPMTGYWIYTTSPLTVSLSVHGIPAPRSLSAGWNLAGISGTSPKTAESALSSLPAWTTCVPFDSSSQQYREGITKGSSSAQTQLTPGEGFWIYLTSPGQLM